MVDWSEAVKPGSTSTGRPSPVGSRVSSGVSAVKAIISPAARGTSEAKVSSDGFRNEVSIPSVLHPNAAATALPSRGATDG